MPTVPVSEPHQVRQIAESFGVDPARYDRTRPAYPEELVARIVSESPGTGLLDVGCGTGIAARQFAARGCDVLGVEPDERMAAFARRQGTDVEVGRFETWDERDRTFDTIVSGTAWHWVDPVAGPVKAARLLPGGGRLALFWHVAEQPEDIATAYADVFRRVVPDSPIPAPPRGGPPRTALGRYLGFLAKVEDGVRAADGLGEPEQWQFEWTRYYTRDEWLDQLPTTGALTRVTPEQLDEILAVVSESVGEGFTMRYTTVVIAAQRD
ncbi:MAG TPA: class I SAM-dependent methyltransferase [Pseudonocardiaceae bacterium]|nr:class I SAM-dependent methyltransferase [Pseudonocardiaceae bacterium]